MCPFAIRALEHMREPSIGSPQQQNRLLLNRSDAEYIKMRNLSLGFESF